MSERSQGVSISRTLLLPSREENFSNSGTFRLRCVLAEDGYDESQVVLAKRLLTNSAADPVERKYNAQLAVFWLLQAAEKGQEESFELLKECYISGVGINALNSFEVQRCIRFSEEEKTARRVACSIFRSIMSDTEDVISEDNFQERISLLFNKEETTVTHKLEERTKVTQKLSETAPPDTAGMTSDHVSFSHVVTSVQSCLEGNVPLITLKRVAEYHRYFVVRYLHKLQDLVLGGAENFFQSLSSPILPFTLMLMCLIFIVCLSDDDFPQKMSLLILLYLATMVSFTCFVVTLNFKGDSMKRWLHLISFLEPSVKLEQIETKYISKMLFVLPGFLLISFIYITISPLSSMPSPLMDLGLLSVVLMFFTDRTINRHRYYVNISLILNILMCLYKASMIQNLLSGYLSFLNYDMSFELFQNIHLHLSFISCLALPLALPYLYTQMCRGTKKSWLSVLLPHWMCVIWMNLAFSQLANTTAADVLTTLTMLLGVLILSNYINSIVSLMLYMFIRVSNIYETEVGLYICLSFIILYVFSSFLFKKFNIYNEGRLGPSLLCLGVVIVSFLVLTPSANPDISAKILTWDKYQTFCHHNSWSPISTADRQILCLPLKGREVRMDGTVTSIDIVDVRNNAALLIGILPEPVRSWVYCTFGQDVTQCTAETPIEKERCKLHSAIELDQCNLNNWNQYRFQVTLEISTRTSPEVHLLADHACADFIRNLREGDSLQAIGKLESNIGSTIPKFILHQANCTSCYTSETCRTFAPTPTLDYSLSLKNIVLFYLSPFIVYSV